MEPYLDAEGFKDPGSDIYRPWTDDEYANARMWLSAAKRTKNVTTASSSYGWKHVASSQLRETHNDGRDFYISNGAFIAAAIDLGFVVKRCRHGAMNVWLNLSKTNRINPNLANRRPLR